MDKVATNSLVIDFSQQISLKDGWRIHENRSTEKGPFPLNVGWLKTLPVKQVLNHYRRDAGIYCGPGFLGCIRLASQLAKAAQEGRITLPEEWHGKRVICTGTLMARDVHTAMPFIYKNGIYSVEYLDTSTVIAPDMLWLRVEPPRKEDPIC